MRGCRPAGPWSRWAARPAAPPSRATRAPARASRRSAPSAFGRGRPWAGPRTPGRSPGTVPVVDRGRAGHVELVDVLRVELDRCVRISRQQRLQPNDEALGLAGRPAVLPDLAPGIVEPLLLVVVD